MNVRDIIESGMLESYVLGILSDEERLQVEEWLRRFPELQEELARIEATIELFSERHAVTPPPELREQIWESLNRSIPSDPQQPVQIAGTAMRWLRIVTALAIVELIIVIGSGIWLWNLSAQFAQFRLASEQELQKTGERIQTLESHLSDFRHYVRTMWGIAKVVPLYGTGQQPTARASVCWDTSSGKLFVALPILDPLPDDKQYQLWALVDGKPSDAGVFTLDTNRLLYPMKSVGAADGFAVTIEPHGGSAEPTLSNMVLVSKLPKPKLRMTERGTR